MTRCCGFCFDDSALIRNDLGISDSRGPCPRCKSTDTNLYSPADLRDSFLSIVSVYNLDPDGDSLFDLLRSDWNMFLTLSEAESRALVIDTYGDPNIDGQRFKRDSEDKSASRSRAFEDLSNELKCNNRFFPSKGLDVDDFKDLASWFEGELDEIGRTWYRARIEDKVEFAVTQLGAPPPDLAGSGRANPVGISYLYLASSPEIAISEVRAMPAHQVAVGKFVVDNGLKVLDLRDPRKFVSAFALGDTDAIRAVQEVLPLMQSLAYALSRPIIPHAGPIEYIPTQYVCELIKRCAYDGVLYSSSKGEGVNLALFDPAKATGVSVERFEIKSIQLTSEQIMSH